jgi:predicted lysophospholipase L1 biosynthesis ABC-type transport system permease subunit
MTPRGYTIRPPSNPVLQALYIVLGGILLIGAVIVGAFVLAFVLGFAIIASLIVYARVWWLSRKLGRDRGSLRPGSGSGAGGASKTEALEVEYTVVSERDERSD